MVLVLSTELAPVYQHLSCAVLKINQDRKLLNRKGVLNLLNDEILSINLSDEWVNTHK